MENILDLYTPYPRNSKPTINFCYQMHSLPREKFAR